MCCAEHPKHQGRKFGDPEVVFERKCLALAPRFTDAERIELRRREGQST
jgi:hypothetical protein